jgi:hypothetical protein
MAIMDGENGTILSTMLLLTTVEYSFPSMGSKNA